MNILTLCFRTFAKKKMGIIQNEQLDAAQVAVPADAAPTPRIFDDSVSITGHSMLEVVGAIDELEDENYDLWLSSDTSARYEYEMGPHSYDITLYDHPWGTEFNSNLPNQVINQLVSQIFSRLD